MTGNSSLSLVAMNLVTFWKMNRGGSPATPAILAAIGL